MAVPKNTTTALFFHSTIAEKILSAINHHQQQIELSLDLNISTHVIYLEAHKIIIDPDQTLSLDQLRLIAKKKNKVFKLENQALKVLECRNDFYYKLVPTDFAPTLQISGIQMHRTKDYDPFVDAQQKASSVVKLGDYVLDTCGGLGYTAIWAKRCGAEKVLCIERDSSVLILREQNPWSQEINHPDITPIFADSNKHINQLDNHYFDSIIHDPPRFSLSGELYGELFYSALYRVLKKGGRLYHYTGTPYSAKHGNRFQLNTVQRLKNVGFRKVEIQSATLGVMALK
jgi:predicted methyltransferase